MSEILKRYHKWQLEQARAVIERIGAPDDLLRFVSAHTKTIHKPDGFAQSGMPQEFESILQDLGLLSLFKERCNIARIYFPTTYAIYPHEMSFGELLIFMAPYYKHLATRKALVRLLFFQAFKLGEYNARDFIADSERAFGKFDKATTRGRRWPHALTVMYQNQLRAHAFEFVKRQFAFLVHSRAHNVASHLWFLGEEPTLMVDDKTKDTLSLLKNMCAYFKLPNFPVLFDNSVASSIAYFYPRFVGDNVFTLPLKHHRVF